MFTWFSTTSSSHLSDLVLDARIETYFLGDDGATEHLYPSSIGSTRVERWTPDEHLPVLSQNEYSAVRLQQCRSDSTEKRRAVKEVGKFYDGEISVNYSRELETIMKLSSSTHSHLFEHVFGWYENQHSVFLAIEYFPLGSLEPYLARPVPVHETHQIVSQVLEGLDYMHSNSLVHLSLKPSNIMVASRSPRWIVKIAGFGTSKYRRWTDISLKTLPMGTFVYYSPEQLGLTQDSSENGSASDMWSLGVIMFRLLANTTPFGNIHELVQYVSQNNPPFNIWRLLSTAPETVRILVRGLLAADPRSRLPARACVHTDWALERRPSKHRTSDWVSSAPTLGPRPSLASSDISPISPDPGSIKTGSDASGRMPLLATAGSIKTNSDASGLIPILPADEKEVVSPISTSSDGLIPVERRVAHLSLAATLVASEKEVVVHRPAPPAPLHPKKQSVDKGLVEKELPPLPVPSSEKEVVLQVCPSRSPTLESESLYPISPISSGTAAPSEEPKKKGSKLFGFSKKSIKVKPKEKLDKLDKLEKIPVPTGELEKLQFEIDELASDPFKAANRGLRFFGSYFQVSFPLYSSCDQCTRTYFTEHGFHLTARVTTLFCKSHSEQHSFIPFSPIHFFAMARRDIGTSIPQWRSCGEEIQHLLEMAPLDPGLINYGIQFPVSKSGSMVEITPLWLAALDNNRDVVEFLLAHPDIRPGENMKALALLPLLGIPEKQHLLFLQAFNNLSDYDAHQSLQEHIPSSKVTPNPPWVFASDVVLERVLQKCGWGSANTSVPLQAHGLAAPMYVPLIHSLGIIPVATKKNEFSHTSRLELFKTLLKHGADVLSQHAQMGPAVRPFSRRLGKGLELLTTTLSARALKIVCEEVSGLVQILEISRTMNPEKTVDGLEYVLAGYSALDRHVRDATKRVQARHKPYYSKSRGLKSVLGGRSKGVPELGASDQEQKTAMWSICGPLERTYTFLAESGQQHLEKLGATTGARYQPRLFFEGSESEVSKFIQQLDGR